MAEIIKAVLANSTQVSLTALRRGGVGFYMSKPMHVWFVFDLLDAHLADPLSTQKVCVCAFASAGHFLRNLSLSGRHNGSAGGLQSNLPLCITISPLTQTWRPSSCPLGTNTEPEEQAAYLSQPHCASPMKTSICFGSTKILSLTILFFLQSSESF